MPIKEKRPFTFAAVGQALFRRDLKAYEDTSEFRGVLDVIRKADVSFTNYEGTIMGAYGGWPTKDKAVSGAGAHVFDNLKSMGFDMLSLVNNHAFDLGPGGILSTIEEADRRGFLHAGIGKDFKEASSARFKETPVGMVSLIAMDCSGQPDYVYALDATEDHGSRPGINRQRAVVKNEKLVAHEEDQERNMKIIRNAASRSDFTVVYLHNHYWEPEPETTSEWTKLFARGCVDVGVDAVVIHGVPLLQGIEVYKRRPLFYGLGNFLFHSVGQTQMWIDRMGYRPWESVIGNCHFAASGDLLYIDLLPIHVGGDPHELLQKKYTHLDAPRLASATKGTQIMENLQRLSKDMSTEITITNGRGRIDVRS